ncbi:MAG TPA: CCA tRNA nucleotidyltransferase [Geobacteraceae bacterium]
MIRVMDDIVADRHVQVVRALADMLDVTAYLVGGGLRDLFLGRAVKDLDFALSGAAEEFPRSFAERIGGSFFWLDRERKQSRVVARREGKSLTFDFAPLRGESITEDLLLRDFTINAMALELADAPVFIDPLNGAGDVRERLIRACVKTSLEDDPLRLLRAIRFAVTLGFTIEAGTWDAISIKGALLDKVAGERVRDELFQILAAPRVSVSLKYLCDSGLMSVLVPPPRTEIPFATVAARIQQSVRVEEMVHEAPQDSPDQAQEVHDLLGREVEGGITVLSLMKLAAFVSGGDGIGSPEAWASRLRMGRKATRMLELFSSDMAPVFASLAGRRTIRAMFHFFRDYEPAGVGLVLLGRVRGEAAESLCAELTRYYFDEYDPAGGELLLSAGEIMEMLGVGQGPEVGAAQGLLREAERRGIVNDGDEAREFLGKNLLTKHGAMR